MWQLARNVSSRSSRYVCYNHSSASMYTYLPIFDGNDMSFMDKKQKLEEKRADKIVATMYYEKQWARLQYGKLSEKTKKNCWCIIVILID